MFNRYLLFIILIILILSYSCQPKLDDDVYERIPNKYDDININFTASFAPSSSNPWVFMIYIDGANNLEQNAMDDLDEIKIGVASANNSNMEVYVLIDRIEGHYNGDGDWTGTALFKIDTTGESSLDGSGKSLPNSSDGDYNNDEMNMGDPNTLENFISYCKENNGFTSPSYSLILWNHGGGMRNLNSSISSSNIKAICWDDESYDSSGEHDTLYLDEVYQAVGANFSSTEKLDFIGFDACLMGTVEVFYEFRELAKYGAGSMANEQGDGWDYHSIFSTMDSGNTSNGDELVKLVVKSYKEFVESISFVETQVAVDISKISQLKNKLDEFATAIYYEDKKAIIEAVRDVSYHFYQSNYSSIDYPFYDLNDFCQQIILNSDISNYLKDKAYNVITQLGDTVIAAYAGNGYGNYYGLGSDVKRGLSIFFSRGNYTYNGDSLYAYQWWYTDQDTTEYGSDKLYGKIDFANINNDSTINTWKELMDIWYK